MPRHGWVGDKLGVQVWGVSRPGEGGQWREVELTDPAEVNLYDLDKWVIRCHCQPAQHLTSHGMHVPRPATEARQCSLVEVLASGPQSPDYFVSHWWPLPLCPKVLHRSPRAGWRWGEPVVDFLECIRLAGCS